MQELKRILVVDDEKEFQILLKDALELRKFEVIAADNAVEAGLELASAKPSLIIMDIRMPGINGIEACQAIRKNPATENIPIIIISSVYEDSFRSKARKLKIEEYLTKPVDTEHLIKRINELT